MPRIKRAKKANGKPQGRRVVALSPKQREFLEADSLIVILMCGIGFGKTRIGVTRLFLRAQDGDSCLVIAPSFSVLRKASFPMMIKVAKELGFL